MDLKLLLLLSLFGVFTVFCTVQSGDGTQVNKRDISSNQGNGDSRNVMTTSHPSTKDDDQLTTTEELAPGDMFRLPEPQPQNTPQNSDQSNPDKVFDYLTSPWLVKVVPSVYIMVFIVSLPLNVMAIIMFLFKVKVKKPAVVYMLNLAAADVLFVIGLPFMITYRFSQNNWLVGEAMCRFFISAFYCNMYCSILLMTSMSVDRFLAVVYPMQSLSWRSLRQSWLVCLFVWIISIASTVPFLMSQQTQYVSMLNSTTCYDIPANEELLDFYIYYFSTFLIAFFALPLIVTIVCYTVIIRRLSATDIESTCKRSRAVVLTMIVLCVFVLCFGPTNVLFLVHFLIFYNRSTSELLFFTYLICISISSIHCFLDPLIYFYASSQCQRYVYNLLCCNKAVSTTTLDSETRLTKVQ